MPRLCALLPGTSSLTVMLRVFSGGLTSFQFRPSLPMPSVSKAQRLAKGTKESTAETLVPTVLSLTGTEVPLEVQ